MIKILIADDHAIVRRGVRDILREGINSLEITEVDSVKEATKTIFEDDFNIILLDISFPDGNGLEILNQIQSMQSKAHVLFLSMYPEEQYARRVFKAGADGYLTKDSAPTELLTAIEKVLSGGKYVTLSLAEKLAEELSSENSTQLHENLSNREYQVLLALGRGKKISEIAEELSLSPKTISTYRTRILEKLKLTTTAEIIHYVVDRGL